QPRLQLAVGDHLPDVRMHGARGDGPVHPPDVVAGLVLARLSRLRARSRDQAEVVAVQDTVELALDRELELPQRRRQLRVIDLSALERWRMTHRRLLGFGRRPLAATVCI